MNERLATMAKELAAIESTRLRAELEDNKHRAFTLREAVWCLMNGQGDTALRLLNTALEEIDVQGHYLASLAANTDKEQP